MSEDRSAERTGKGTFVKGVSGNPKGRPRKQPERLRMPEVLRNVVFEVAEAPVVMTTAEGKVEVQAYRAVLVSLRNEALKGKPYAQRLWLREMEKASVVNGEMTRLARKLAIDMLEQDKLIKHYQTLIPRIVGGVVTRLADGTVIPNVPLSPELFEIAKELSDRAALEKAEAAGLIPPIV